MLRAIAYTAAWAVPAYLLFSFFRWATRPHCPHCQCENYLDDTAFTPRSRTKLVVIDRRFACGYSVAPEGHQTGMCKRLAYRRRPA
jgi:hypothetical protein